MTGSFDFLKQLSFIESDLHDGDHPNSKGNQQLIELVDAVRDAWAKHHFEIITKGTIYFGIFEWELIKREGMPEYKESIKQVERVWSREKIELELKKKLEESK